MSRPRPARERRVEMTVCGSPAPDEAAGPTLPMPPPPGKSAKWRRVGKTMVRAMSKLDESQVQWIVRQRRKGTPVAEVAEAMKVSRSWVKTLARRYRGVPAAEIEYPLPMGRRRYGLPGRTEHSAVLSGYYAHAEGAALLAKSIEAATGLRIAHHLVHRILRDHGLARAEGGKAGRRGTSRYVKQYSNTMWHMDYKLLPDKRWLVSCQDDASRKFVAWGAFERATTANALKVLDEGIASHGAPLSALTDRGSVFYATESEKKAKGVSEFEAGLKKRGIRHILARVRHPQTNGKLERAHGEIERKLHLFVDASAARTTRGADGGGPSHVGGPFHAAPAADPIDRFFDWYNNHRPHMALDRSRRETPAQAYERKKPKEGDNVQKDLEESGAYA